jgi:ethanolamine utilization protein EutP (predicted NTPase)
MEDRRYYRITYIHRWDNGRMKQEPTQAITACDPKAWSGLHSGVENGMGYRAILTMSERITHEEYAMAMYEQRTKLIGGHIDAFGKK